MPTRKRTHNNKPNKRPNREKYHPREWVIWWKSLKKFQKFFIILIAFSAFYLLQAYAFAYWYQQKHKNEPLNLGVTFTADYANYLGLDPHKTLLALRDDLHFKRFRLVSYWEDIEKSPGVYDFSELDWQMKQINEVHGTVSLAIGLRQPRWPECHMPTWAENEPYSVWYPQLKDFMTAVIQRYQNNSSLVSYQLENEYYLSAFAKCPNSTKERINDEYKLVKSLDNKTPVIISLSNNYLGIPITSPRPDQYGVSVYKLVWDRTITHNYFEYPFPDWYYSWRAALTEIVTGKSSMLHELQAEPWPPKGILNSSQEELSKSMNPTLLQSRISYGEKTGFRDIDLWGGEYWYYEKTKFNNPGLWNVVKQAVKDSQKQK
jgi:hypothetical protein